MRIILALALCGACGGIEGEPMEGTLEMQYGDTTADFVVGAAVEDENTPGLMLVQVGTDNVDCDTYLDVFLSFSNPEGHFLYFSVDVAPGTYTDGFISAMQSEGGSTKINSTSGSVTIDSVDGRIVGSVEVDTTDDEFGTISASGTFDVVRCF
jgi:hypothetical protein